MALRTRCTLRRCVRSRRRPPLDFHQEHALGPGQRGVVAHELVAEDERGVAPSA